MEDTGSHIFLQAELSRLKAELETREIELEEATDIIEAIRNGEVDALVMKSENGHQLFTLKSSDQTYRIFIEQMTEGAVTIGTKGNVLYANSQFASMLNLPLERVTGKPFVDFVSNEDKAYYEDLLERSWTSNSKGELLLYSNDQVFVPVLLSLNKLVLEEGLSMSVILTDLSEQKKSQELLRQKNEELQAAQALTRKFNLHLEETVAIRTKDLEDSIYQKTIVEKELRDNQERLSRILETMAEGVGIVDFEGNLTYANPMAKRILGFNDEQTLNVYQNNHWENLMLDGHLLSATEHPIAIAMAKGEPVYDHEIGIQPAVGDQFYISINATPIRNEYGEIVAGLATFMDVTQRRKVIQQKDEFISVASHELKTPITSLKASLQLLKRTNTGVESELFHKLMDQANKSMNRVSVLIEDLLNASKFTGGQLHLSKKKVNLYDLISGCCEDIRLDAQHQIRIEGDRKLEVSADPNKIDQVIINFINNAIKYANESLEIRVEITKTDHSAKVSVSDEGPGIKPEVMSHLFERYYRVDHTGRQYSGLGLGLYISSEIIKKHNGKIGVLSELEEGSTFWFTLPL
ncbi:MAG: ATP-binding protein [Bacteroidota bacterium]